MERSLQEQSQWWRKVIFFFPIQLLFLHLKRNHFLLLFWLIFFGIITQNLGVKFGLPYLFFYPEYLGNVDFFSHAILGFSVAGFIMAFNLYSYVMHGYKFSFIATVSRPFYKFSLNNLVIPAIFILLYLYEAASFQLGKEFLTPLQVFLNMIGFMCGLFVFFFFSMYYFFKTNKDMMKLTGKSEETLEEEYRQKGTQTAFHKKEKWYELFNTEAGWHVDTYMSRPFKIHIARESRHYDTDLLRRVLAQNHINASIFEFAMIGSFLLLGTLGENPVFQIPAGASIFLLFTMLIMTVSAIYSWLKGWTLSFLIIVFLVLNSLSSKTELFSYKNFAYGLDYSTNPAEYSHTVIDSLGSDFEQHRADLLEAVKTLDKWKAKNQRSMNDAGKRPKLVLVCTSGGGLRSALWTFRVLQKVDSTLQGKLMDQIHLITGSSGGMLGAAYYRELFRQKIKDTNLQLADKKYVDNMAKDLLNPLAFTIATNDIFIRWRKFEDGPFRYTIDRGFMFEKHLNLNLDSAFSGRLIEYVIPERNSQIPTMLFCPTVINDGRGMIISSQPVSFLTNCSPYGENITNPTSDEYVEFTKLFKDQNAYNLKFSSAVRMSASFPYVMPMVTMPTNPAVEVMDAGYRDNYGIRLALRYLYNLRNWINTNTDGVVIIQIRDREKEVEVDHLKNSVAKRLVRPLGNLYDNIFYTQDYDNDQLLQFADSWLNTSLETVNFFLPTNQKNRVSLSWHLTRLEKQQVVTSLDTMEVNRKAMKQLQEILQAN